MLRKKKSSLVQTLHVPGYIAAVAQRVADSHGFAPSSVIAHMLKIGCEKFLEERERTSTERVEHIARQRS